MRLAAFVGALMLLAACEKPAPPDQPAEPGTETETPQTTAKPEDSAEATPAPPAGKLEITDFDEDAIPQPVGVGDGKVEHGLSFQDANGENLVVLWSDADQGLFAKHVVVKDGAVVRELREVKQVRGDCEFDYSSAFVPGAFGVTDLDADGFGEVTFAYKYACRSDMSPQDYKLLVTENGDKAILRGAEIMVVGGDEPIGDGKFEPEGFEGRPKLLEHASKVWKRNVVTTW